MTTPRYLPPVDPVAWANGMRDRLREQLPDLLLDDADPWVYMADYAGEQWAALVEAANESLASAYALVLEEIAAQSRTLAPGTYEYLYAFITGYDPNVKYISYQQRLANAQTSVYVAGENFADIDAAAMAEIELQLNLDPLRPLRDTYSVDGITRHFFDIRADVWYDPRKPNPHDVIVEQVKAFVDQQTGLAHEWYTAAIEAQLWTDGVVNTRLLAPSGNLTVANPNLAFIHSGYIGLNMQPLTSTGTT